jgi:imidazolonepropionase-like amidohydrolase
MKNRAGVFLRCTILAATVMTLWGVPQRPAPTAILFEGARLIPGDGSPPVQNSAFLVEGDRFRLIDRRGGIRATEGVARVSLNGKTVMPAMVDLHTHLGYTIVRTNQTQKETYTRQNLEDHLKRLAFYGVAATLSMGVDRGDIPFQVRQNPVPGAAIFFTAGAGIALPGMGPGADYRKDAAIGVTTEAEARKAVQELAAKRVDMVKFWVDDRNGTVQKLPPNVYRAVIDEAHRNNLRAVAHIYYLEDAKELMRAGVDGFAHGVRDKDIDEEFMNLLRQRRVFFMPNLPERPLTAADLPLISESLPPAQVQQLRAQVTAATPNANAELFNIQARNLKKISDARVAQIGFGTDSGVSIGWTAHVELADMVAAGMTPDQVITAATRTSADILKQPGLGMVVAGRSADFIVLDGNPLENILNTRKISRVYIRGKEIDRKALMAEFTRP